MMMVQSAQLCAAIKATANNDKVLAIIFDEAVGTIHFGRLAG